MRASGPHFKCECGRWRAQQRLVFSAHFHYLYCGLQTRSAPMKEMKELELEKEWADVASRYIVRSGTAEALAQSSKPA